MLATIVIQWFRVIQLAVIPWWVLYKPRLTKGGKESLFSYDVFFHKMIYFSAYIGCHCKP